MLSAAILIPITLKAYLVFAAASAIYFLRYLPKYKELGKFKFVLFLVFIAFFTESLGTYIVYILTKKASVLYNIFAFIELFLFSAYYYEDNTLFQKHKVIFLGTFSVIALTYGYIIFQKGFVPMTYYAFGQLAYVICSLFGLYKLLNFDFESNLLTKPEFWINIGVLLFFSGVFFLYTIIVYVSKNDLDLAQKLFSINHILSIVYYSLLSVGLICQIKYQKPLS
jgi:hypothetical protein